MVARTRKVGDELMLYDDALIDRPRPELFSPDYWQRQDALRKILPGRGATWIVDSASGDWVLRHYRRGGLIGHVIRERYLWLGLQRARPWREWQLLEALYQRELPSPRPIAARVARHGLFYSGDLLTEFIDNAATIAVRMREWGIGAINWARIGECLRRFHRAGVYHADLNAHNILLAPGDQVYLIDFDKGQLRYDKSGWRQANLKRLKRSLYKVAVHDRVLVDSIAWPDLLMAYEISTLSS